MIFFIKDEQYNERYRSDDTYWEVPSGLDYSSQKYKIYMGFGFSIAGLVGLDNPKDSNILGGFFLIVGLFLIIFSILVLVNKTTYQEQIYDRYKGTITFPDMYWRPNITMHFDDIKFIRSYYRAKLSGINGLTPKVFSSHFNINLKHINLQQLTLLTWYMDKNRPLPSLIQFESHYEKDFERRKKEGFPPPLYFSFFSTNEKTKKQDKERRQFWFDEITYDYEKRTKKTCIARGKNEIFDMKSRQWHEKSMIHKIDGVFYSSTKHKFNT